MNENDAVAARVILVGHSMLFADAVTRGLAAASITVVGTVAPTPSGLDMVRGTTAAVVLLEANGTVGETAALLRRIQRITSVPVVVVGSPLSDAELVELVEVGCCGCVPRDASLHDLVNAVANVCCGRAACSPYLAALVSMRIRDLARNLAGDDELPPLTPREADVLLLAARGRSNKEIARELDIWLQTVKTHLHNVYQKLGVRSRRSAVAKATRLGLIRETR
jgi:two-component system, NarL family, nitrate/nitrite response regulator NarL